MKKMAADMRRLGFVAGAVLLQFGAAGSLLASEEGGLNPLSFRTDLALWTGVVFLGLLLILGKFAFRPIVDALDAREKSMADKVAAADKANADARDLLETYRQKLADSQLEVKQMLDAAQAAAEKTGQSIIDTARIKAAEEHQKAIREIESASDAALSQLAAKSAELATNLAGKILKEKINPADHARLIEGAISDFSKN